MVLAARSARRSRRRRRAAPRRSGVAIGVAVAARASPRRSRPGRRPRSAVAVPVKYFSTKSRRQADRVEDLGAAIGLVGGDAHLGHHLQHALADRLDVVAPHRLGRRRDLALDAQRSQRLEGEIGVDRLGADSRRGRRNGGPRAPRRSRRRGRSACAGPGGSDGGGPRRWPSAAGIGIRSRRGRAVREDQDVGVGEHRLGRFPAQPLQRRLERLAVAAAGQVASSVRGAEGAVERLARSRGSSPDPRR